MLLTFLKVKEAAKMISGMTHKKLLLHAKKRHARHEACSPRNSKHGVIFPFIHLGRFLSFRFSNIHLFLLFVSFKRFVYLFFWCCCLIVLKHVRQLVYRYSPFVCTI